MLCNRIESETSFLVCKHKHMLQNGAPPDNYRVHSVFSPWNSVVLIILRFITLWCMVLSQFLEVSFGPFNIRSRLFINFIITIKTVIIFVGKLDHATIIAYEVGNYQGDDDENYSTLDDEEEEDVRPFFYPVSTSVITNNHYLNQQQDS